MEKENKIEGKEIHLKDLWNLFVQRFWIMLAVGIVCMVLVFFVNELTFTPRYESTATLYILRQGESDTSNDASVDFSLSLKLVNDCTYFLKSHTVLDQVIQTLDLELSYQQLYGCVSTYNPDNTRILEVKVEADTPEQAKAIVDQICSIGPETIAQAMGYEQVHLFENGTLVSNPCNTLGVVAYLLAGFVAAAGVYCVFLVMFLMDDRFETDEDIERILGLSVLGSIPNADAQHHARYGYYSAYGAQNSGRNGKKKRSK